MSFDGYMQICFTTIIPALIAIVIEIVFSNQRKKKKYIIFTIGIWVLVLIIVSFTYSITKYNNNEIIDSESHVAERTIESGDQSPIFTGGGDNKVVYNNYNMDSETVTVPIEETELVEPLGEFPFSFNSYMIFSDTQDITIPDSAFEGESGSFTVSIPVDIQNREYRSDKVPLNDDIHGFIVNDIYYCNDNPPEFDIDDEYCITDTRNEIDLHSFNYYNFGDYWLCLHRVDISFIGSDNFSPDIEGATIVLKEKKSQKSTIIENNYTGDYVTFKCSTGDYTIEIRKNNIAYVQDLHIDQNIEKRILVISKKDYRRLQ